MLRIPQPCIETRGDLWTAEAEAAGKPLDPKHHEPVVDVKAVTLHGFRLEPTDAGWRAPVILDI